MYLREARHLDKFIYTLSNRSFYEPFEREYMPLPEYVDITSSILEDYDMRWKTTRDGFWFHVHPPHPTLPSQGWKIHISATITNAPSILRIVARIALLNNTAFKFALDRNILSMITSKRWDRGSSGKFITLYPLTTPSFRFLIEQLYNELQHQEGPYILSDKRYKDCRVLYYRYGGIKQTTRLNFRGESIPVLLSPDGDLIPDIRTPYFHCPSWTQDPFPSNYVESQESTLNDGKYLVKQALSFSNSGGVYLAQDQTTGVEVIIKEARPHTLQDGRGNDAITLLKKEYDILQLFRDTGIAPLPIGSFYDWEHFYIVQEYVLGTSIREHLLGESTLMLARPSLADNENFYRTFTGLFKSFCSVVRTLHERSVIFGDLSASNIKIDPINYSVRLLDFEGAQRLGMDDATFLYTPGFKDPLTFNSMPEKKDDLYALAAIMLYTIFPVHALSSLRNDIYETVLSTLLEDIGWADTKIFTVINGLSKGVLSCTQAINMLDAPGHVLEPHYSDTVTADDCKDMIQGLGHFILANMHPSDSYLFPADPYVYRTNPLSLGFGACGVLYALAKCGFEVPHVAFEWLERTVQGASIDSYPPGLLTGYSGIAWVLSELGITDLATVAMERANTSPLLYEHHSYLYGMAGIGLANLHFYLLTQEQKYLAMAEQLAQRLIASSHEDELGASWEADDVVHLGLGYGQSGVALFFLRLFQITHDDRFLSFGRKAVDFDLSQGLEVEDGVMSFPRAMGDFTLDPYLEEGSAGIAKVALRYRLTGQIDPILADTHRKYSAFPGLLYGLGSFVDALVDAFLITTEPRFYEMAKRPISGLKEIYAIRRPQGIATPGDGLHRVSLDFGTGAAGILRAIYRFSNIEHADFLLDATENIAVSSIAVTPSSAI
jgi:serine/threonine protein kinase